MRHDTPETGASGGGMTEARDAEETDFVRAEIRLNRVEEGALPAAFQPVADLGVHGVGVRLHEASRGEMGARLHDRRGAEAFPHGVNFREDDGDDLF